MKPHLLVFSIALVPTFASAANIFTPGDLVRAVDASPNPSSNSPGGEVASNVLDQNGGTKYLNFGEARSGFIVTPAGGASTVQSMVLRTGGDAEERDPASFSLYGTNSAITSTDHGFGNSEPWTLISSNSLSLPAGRSTLGSPVDFANGIAYTSYRLVFDTVKNGATANSMQVADVQFFSAAGGAGSSILAVGDAIHPFDLDPLGYPDAENPASAIGGAAGKYLHFGKAGTGLIVKPSVGMSVIDSFSILTANDAPERDPASYSIYGTNDAITSADNSTGTAENWTLIQSGALALTDTRNADSGPMSITNSAAYSAYKIVFNTLKNEGTANSMQVGDIQFFGTLVPEPGSAMLIAGSLVPLLSRRRRR